MYILTLEMFQSSCGGQEMEGSTEYESECIGQVMKRAALGQRSAQDDLPVRHFHANNII